MLEIWGKAILLVTFNCIVIFVHFGDNYMINGGLFSGA